MCTSRVTITIHTVLLCGKSLQQTGRDCAVQQAKQCLMGHAHACSCVMCCVIHRSFQSRNVYFNLGRQPYTGTLYSEIPNPELMLLPEI